MNKPMLRVWIHALAAVLLFWGVTHWLAPTTAFCASALLVAALTVLQYTAGYATGKNQGFDWAANQLLRSIEDTAVDSARDVAKLVKETAEEVEKDLERPSTMPPDGAIVIVIDKRPDDEG